MAPEIGQSYPPEIRQAAVADAIAAGLGRRREVLERYGIHAKTLQRWLRAAGAPMLESSVRNGRAGGETVALKVQVERENLALLAITTAQDLVRRMNQPHIDFRTLGTGNGEQKVQQVEMPLPPSGSIKDYAVAVGILVDKVAVIMGEPTERVEVSHHDQYTVFTENPDARRALERLWQIAAENGASGDAERPALPVGGSSP